MSKRRKQPNLLRGHARMKQNGMRAITLYLDTNEAELIDLVAHHGGARLATWIRRVAVKVAAGQLVPGTDAVINRLAEQRQL